VEIRQDPDDQAAAAAAKYALASGSFGQPDTMRPTQFILKSKVFFQHLYTAALLREIVQKCNS